MSSLGSGVEAATDGSVAGPLADVEGLSKSMASMSTGTMLQVEVGPSGPENEVGEASIGGGGGVVVCGVVGGVFESSTSPTPASPYPALAGIVPPTYTHVAECVLAISSPGSNGGGSSGGGGVTTTHSSASASSSTSSRDKVRGSLGSRGDRGSGNGNTSGGTAGATPLPDLCNAVYLWEKARRHPMLVLTSIPREALADGVIDVSRYKASVNSLALSAAASSTGEGGGEVGAEGTAGASSPNPPSPSSKSSSSSTVCLIPEETSYMRYDNQAEELTLTSGITGFTVCLKPPPAKAVINNKKSWHVSSIRAPKHGYYCLCYVVEGRSITGEHTQHKSPSLTPNLTGLYPFHPLSLHPRSGANSLVVL
jgi:hypothetical protein